MNTKIKLYHVSYNKNDSLCKTFEPRIPYNRWANEDDTTERICLCDSIDRCFSALTELPRVSSNSKSATVIIFEKEFFLNDNKLVCWQELYEKELVPDVALTHEYWYLAPTTMIGNKYEITIDYDEGIPLRNIKYIVPAKLKPLLLDIINEYQLTIDTSTLKSLDPTAILNDYLPQVSSSVICDSIRYILKEEAKKLDPPIHIEPLRMYSNIIYKKI